MLSHRFLEEFQSRLLIPCLRDEAFQDFTFVINGASEVVPLAVDLHKHLVEVPLPLPRFHPLDPSLADIIGEHRSEPVPPEADGLVADVDAPFMEQIFDVSKR